MDSSEVLYRLNLIKARRYQPPTERVKTMARESTLLEFEEAEDIQSHVNAIQYAINLGGVGILPTLEEMLHIHRMLMPFDPRAGYYRGGPLTMVNVNDRRVHGAPVWAIESYYIKLFEDELPFCMESMAFHPRNPLPYHGLARFHYEYEEIHGLWDGNGRVGRILLHQLKAYLDFHHAIQPGHICLLADDRYTYLKLLADGNIDGLADLFERRTVCV